MFSDELVILLLFFRKMPFLLERMTDKGTMFFRLSIWQTFFFSFWKMNKINMLLKKWQHLLSMLTLSFQGKCRSLHPPCIISPTANTDRLFMRLLVIFLKDDFLLLYHEICNMWKIYITQCKVFSEQPLHNISK